MKKVEKIAALIACVAFVFGLASCQNEEVSLAELAYNSKSDQATEYTVTFNANGGSLTKKKTKCRRKCGDSPYKCQYPWCYIL